MLTVVHLSVIARHDKKMHKVLCTGIDSMDMVRTGNRGILLKRCFRGLTDPGTNVFAVNIVVLIIPLGLVPRNEASCCECEWHTEAHLRRR